MATCTYCGRPAGLLRQRHSGCENRHARATSLIPGFFSKFLESSVPVDRFCALLKDAAVACFVKTDELRALSMEGLTQAVSAILERRLLNAGEEDRLAALVETLDFEDSSQPYLMLTKIAILRDISEGRVPERVNLVDPLPVALHEGETVIWVFNHVVSFMARTSKMGETDQFGAGHLEVADYFPYSRHENGMDPLDKQPQEMSGDMVVTSRSLFLFAGANASTRMPLARISDVKCCKGAVSLVIGSKEQVSRAITTDDPWFAANLISGLARRYSNSTRRLAKTS